ncbi:MAG: GlcNAc-PI de-N-acetylase [Chloroflexota bacterium]|nr:MAG: GlcNAc-PI de-N-acetylase [Chloroflexota bacterium]
MTTLASQYPIPKKVLAIFAHPDDAEFFSGGTLARWASEGAQITLFLLTSGDKGTGDRQLPPSQLITTREAETRAAAVQLGFHNVIFQRMPDGELEPTLSMRRAIVRMIRMKQPDTVLSSDPMTRWRGNRRLNHPDHWIVATEVMNAIYPAARDHLNFPELLYDEGLEPHIARYLYLALPTEPNLRIETTQFQMQKLNALREHRSQIKDFEGLKARLEKQMDLSLSTPQMPRYAEYFRLMLLD